MSTSERVPWISKNEWEFCRDHLFCKNLSMKKKALKHLFVWKVRSVNLPVAVECTLILMDVHLSSCDPNLEDEKMLTNTMSFESWYSVAIMRFLNLIMDSNVGDKVSSSMNQLAKQYEIPDWIVDIRHAVAHGPSLPSLSSLKEAVDKCLVWLYESYWSKNVYEDYVSNQNETSLSSTFLCFEVCLLLKRYLLLGFETIFDIPVSDREKISLVLAKNSANFNISIQEWPLADTHKFVLKKLGRHLKKNTEYGKKLVFSILEDDRYLLSPDGLEANRLSDAMLNYWSDVLFVICDSSICYYFLQELINVVNSPVESSWRQHLAALYLEKVLENIVTWKRKNFEIENTENYSKKRKKLKKKSNNLDCSILPSDFTNIKLTEEEISNLIQIVLNKPNENSKVFLKHLFNLLESREYLSRSDELVELIDIYTGSRPSSEDSVRSGDIHTVQELTGKLHLSLDDYISQQIVDETIAAVESTRINEDGKWQDTPLGLLPWQIDFEPWLHIYDSE